MCSSNKNIFILAVFCWLSKAKGEKMHISIWTSLHRNANKGNMVHTAPGILLVLLKALELFGGALKKPGIY